MLDHQCQSCGNTVFSKNASHCKMCGTPVQNICTNENCCEVNEIDAAYCEYCGTPTIYMKLGVAVGVVSDEIPF